MQAFLIDPFAKTVTAVDHNGDYRQIYKLIDAGCFTTAQFNDACDAVYVDDNGLFKSNQKFFLIEGYPQPLAGKGLVLGCNARGKTVAPTVTLDWLKENVDFVTDIIRLGKGKLVMLTAKNRQLAL